MFIGELADRTGVSTRALRHYEERGLLVPHRDTNDYRIYAEQDVVRVAQIQTMIAAGLGTDPIRRYIDCARTGDHGLSLEMCPDLRAELDALAAQLTMQQNTLEQKRERLCALSVDHDNS